MRQTATIDYYQRFIDADTKEIHPRVKRLPEMVRNNRS